MIARTHEPVPDEAARHDTDSHGSRASARPSSARFDRAELDARLLWTVPETAFMCRVGVRTVWRMVADPRSAFPRPRRLRGRTLMARDEVLAFLAQEPRA